MSGTLTLARQATLTGPQEWKDSTATNTLLSMDSSGNLTIGSSALSQTHIVTSSYVSNSTSQDILKIQRAGGAVAITIGYNDNSTRMYLGTSTNHVLEIKTNAATAAIADTTGAWTLGAVARSGTHSLQSINTDTLHLVGGNGTRLVFDTNQITGNTHSNWMIGAQDHVDGGIEFTPSTTAGGFTFTTPIGTATNTGAWTFGLAAGGVTHTFNASIANTSTSVIELNANRLRSTNLFNISSGGTQNLTYPPANCGALFLVMNANSGETAIVLLANGTVGTAATIVNQVNGSGWAIGTGAGTNNKFNYSGGTVTITNNNGGTRTYYLMSLWIAG